MRSLPASRPRRDNPEDALYDEAKGNLDAFLKGLSITDAARKIVRPALRQAQGELASGLPFVLSLSPSLRAGLSNHEQPHTHYLVGGSVSRQT
jgi:hypothetical protein